MERKFITPPDNPRPEKRERFRYIPSYPRTFSPLDIEAADSIVSALKAVEAARAQFAEAELKLRRAAFSDTTPRRVRKAFEDFLAQGGITAAEFRAYCKGKFNGVPVRRNKHLRLVASVEVVQLRPVKRTPYEGPDEAA